MREQPEPPAAAEPSRTFNGQFNVTSTFDDMVADLHRARTDAKEWGEALHKARTERDDLRAAIRSLIAKVTP
jgi:hypothetical protein